MGSVIEILVLQALAHEAQGDIHAALVPLERALVLAEPECYVRVFVDEGMPMAQLLSDVATRGSRRTTRANCWRHLKLMAVLTPMIRLASPLPLRSPLSSR
jgi:LuxR family maltose regulon positive regulatory protein